MVLIVSMTLNSSAATQLPQIRFETSKLSVNEDVNDPVIVCIQLVNGYLMEEAASVDLITREGSATGMCICIQWTHSLNVENYTLTYLVLQLHKSNTTDNMSI